MLTNERAWRQPGVMIWRLSAHTENSVFSVGCVPPATWKPCVWENNKGTQTQRSEELQEAFIAGLLQILHTSQELMCGCSAKKKINFIYMASVSRLSLEALQKP